MPRPGSRGDYYAMLEDIMEKPETWMARNYGPRWQQFRKSLREYREDMRPHQSIMPITTTYWGETGVGKSHAAFKEAGSDAYTMPDSIKGGVTWADGYVGQRNVVIDEYEGDFSLRTILHMTDKYPYTMQTKGGHTHWAPKHIWFTSNQHPSKWYPDVEWEGSPLQRRLTEDGSSISEIMDRFAAPRVKRTRKE